MTRILANLSAFNFLALATAFVVGWLSMFWGSRSNPDDRTYLLHVYLGIIAGTTTLGLHCLVFIYFLGTGRWVKEVAIAYQIPDEPLPKLTRELKRKAFPAALAAMLVVIGTAAVGAGVATLRWWWVWHALLGAATLSVNAWAFAVEHRCVAINGGVIDGVMREVDRIRAERGLPTNAEAWAEAEEK